MNVSADTRQTLNKNTSKRFHFHDVTYLLQQICSRQSCNLFPPESNEHIERDLTEKHVLHVQRKIERKAPGLLHEVTLAKSRQILEN